jgi:hypothetical protein
MPTFVDRGEDARRQNSVVTGRKIIPQIQYMFFISL